MEIWAHFAWARLFGRQECRPYLAGAWFGRFGKRRRYFLAMTALAAVGSRGWKVASWKPAIVVPGHGDIGGVEIVNAVRDYIVDLGQRVAREREAGKGADAIVADLAPSIRAEHPDWSAPEWIDFAIRYYSTLR